MGSYTSCAFFQGLVINPGLLEVISAYCGPNYYKSNTYWQPVLTVNEMTLKGLYAKITNRKICLPANPALKSFTTLHSQKKIDSYKEKIQLYTASLTKQKQSKQQNKLYMPTHIAPSRTTGCSQDLIEISQTVQPWQKWKLTLETASFLTFFRMCQRKVSFPVILYISPSFLSAGWDASELVCYM